MVGTYTYQTWYLCIRARASTCKYQVLTLPLLFYLPLGSTLIPCYCDQYRCLWHCGHYLKAWGCEHVEVVGGGVTLDLWGESWCASLYKVSRSDDIPFSSSPLYFSPSLFFALGGLMNLQPNIHACLVRAINITKCMLLSSTSIGSLRHTSMMNWWLPCLFD